MFRVPRIFLILPLLLFCPAAVSSEELPKDILEKIDAAIASAYKAASAKLPCKVGTGGKLHMLHWQDVDKCMSQAISFVDWEALAKQLDGIRPRQISQGEFATAVENSLSRSALPYEKVFAVKDQKALLPLTNPILKYLPPNSLQGQPVYDQKGAQVGTFAGVYYFEHAGETLSGTSYRLALFQYVDSQGKIQVPSTKLLRDFRGVPFFGVLWAKIMTQPGFRLPSEKLTDASSIR